MYEPGSDLREPQTTVMTTFGFNNRTMAALAQPSTIMVEVPARPGRRGKSGGKAPRSSSNRRTALVMMSTDDLHNLLKTLSTTSDENLALLNGKLQIRKVKCDELPSDAYDALGHCLTTAVRKFDSIDVVPTSVLTSSADGGASTRAPLSPDQRQLMLEIAKGHAFELIGNLRQYVRSWSLPAVKACFFDDVMLCRDTHLLQHALNQIMSEICVHGVLDSSPFKHGARTFEPRDHDKTLSGGIITFNDVSQLMATFPVATSGQPVYFCLTGVSLEQGACSMQWSHAFVEAMLKLILKKITYRLDDPDDVRVFASTKLHAYFSAGDDDESDESETVLFETLKQQLSGCLRSIMMRPHASVVATFSHGFTPDLPTIHAKKYVGMSTMMSKAVYNDGDIANIVRDKRGERRRELPRPFVIRCI